jgi:hypothetical protein
LTERHDVSIKIGRKRRQRGGAGDADCGRMWVQDPERKRRQRVGMLAMLTEQQDVGSKIRSVTAARGVGPHARIK